MTSSSNHLRTSILNYWFGEDSTLIHPEKAQLWFKKSDQTDQEIAETFGSSIEIALNGGYSEWEAKPKSSLAKIILLDQFTRNVFRDTPKAFAGDPIALRIALKTTEHQEDLSLTAIERVFCYLPLEHSEDLAMQERSVALFAKLKDDVSPENQIAYQNFYDYAVKHRDVVARFGRFPHRNEILGRASTAEESLFLQQPGSRF